MGEPRARATPRVAAVLAAAAVLAILGVAGRQCSRSGPSADRYGDTGMSLAEALGTGDTAGYARAYEPRPFDFPEDHGAHPEFRTEWWYFTGNLETDVGAPFGYQLTLFRSALAPESGTLAASRPGEEGAAANGRNSAWATNQVYMAHFAVTDVASERFYAFDRFARGAAGLAGAQAGPFKVWVEDWSGEAESRALASATFPLRLRAAEGDVAIDLVLERGKPIVLNGERGLSRKGPEPGNASHYYSLTRMPTAGSIRIGDATHRVHGASWLDR
ncbi:MAG: lipocalin-like domain-containing protein, partial [Longimicrobiales bacterium]